MARPNIEKVEIVEPPIGELSKSRSSFKRSCLTGCGCVIFFIAALLVGLRFFIGSGPTKLKTIPPDFPVAIGIYDQDSIETITRIPGRYKSRGLTIAAIFPKLILSPLLLNANEPSDVSSTTFTETAKHIVGLITSPVTDGRDTVRIEWKNMDAEPDFVVSYYQNELRKAGFNITDTVVNGTTKQFTFENSTLSGTLFVQSDEEKNPGTDYAVLTVNLPKQ